MPATKTIVFTQAALKALPPAERGRRDYYRDAKDRDLRLSLAVTDRGAKTFLVQRRVAGRPVRMVIGRWPDTSITQARKRAAAINIEVAAGADPYERTRPLRSGLTLGTFFEQEYLPKHARPFKRTWQQDADMFMLYVRPLADQRLAAVRRRDVHQLHIDLGKDRGHRTANRVVALLRIVFKLAIAWEFLDGDNPATGIRKFPEQSRERFLRPEEVPALFAALEADITRRTENAEQARAQGRPVPPAHALTFARDFVLLALFSGARRSNLLAMAWRDLDLDRATWMIAASETKTARTYQIVLAQPAMQILRHRRALVPATCPWVFPSVEGGGERHQTNVKDAWQQIRQESGLTDLRLHDLRRTLGSWQAAAGSSLPIIGRSLGHTTPAATAVYARLDLDPVRRSVEGATAALVAAGHVREVKL